MLTWSQPYPSSKKMLHKLAQSLQAACAPQEGPEDQVTRLTNGSGTSACALKAMLLLETLALRKTLVNRDFHHDV